jgi:hypothetical protein
MARKRKDGARCNGERIASMTGTFDTALRTRWIAAFRNYFEKNGSRGMARARSADALKNVRFGMNLSPEAACESGDEYPAGAQADF